MPKETPRKRKSLTSAQKKKVCLKKISTPFLKQKDLAKEYDISKEMFPIIEEALTVWIDKALQAGLILTESILTTKALDFNLLCNEEKFKASTGIISEYGEPSYDESINYEVYENNADIQLELEYLKELEEVQVLINKLDFEDSFTAE
ncbi:unnamed protein product, partial [Rhizophagus irregularis]